MRYRIEQKYRKIQVFCLGCLGINPYTEGTLGSYLWKIKRSRKLTQKEEKFKEVEHPHSKENHPEMILQLLIDLQYAELFDNLPRQMRDLVGDMEIHQFRATISKLMPLSSHLRERQAIGLANKTLLIGILAFVVNIVTLAVIVILHILEK